MDLGFVGLGATGTGMARVLLRAGHGVSVWNRTRERAASSCRPVSGSRSPSRSPA